jgi:hypothetical protein
VRRPVFAVGPIARWRRVRRAWAGVAAVRSKGSRSPPCRGGKPLPNDGQASPFGADRPPWAAGPGGARIGRATPADRSRASIVPCDTADRSCLDRADRSCLDRASIARIDRASIARFDQVIRAAHRSDGGSGAVGRNDRPLGSRDGAFAVLRGGRRGRCEAPGRGSGNAASLVRHGLFASVAPHLLRAMGCVHIFAVSSYRACARIRRGFITKRVPPHRNARGHRLA